MITVTGIVFALARIWNHFYQKSDGLIIVTITFWVLYMITQSYYAGAMTMFFSSEVTIPFETLPDVLEAYPSWKLNIKKGLQMQFQGSSVPKVFL